MPNKPENAKPTDDQLNDDQQSPPESVLADAELNTRIVTAMAAYQQSDITSGSKSTQWLPEVHFDESVSKESPPQGRLGYTAMEGVALKMHKAMHESAWLGLTTSADHEKVMELLRPLNAADSARLEQIYARKYDQPLRSTLAQQLGEGTIEYAQAISQLNRQDGKTNDAGALMVALKRINEDPEAGNIALRAVFSTLNQQQVKELGRKFGQDYHQSWTAALNELGTAVTPQTHKAIQAALRGTDHKTSADVEEVARAAVREDDTRLFSEAIRGDSPAAIQARKDLKADEKLVSQLDSVALDYLNEGRVSLKTIAEENSGKWIFNSKESIDSACLNASDTERAQFARGRTLAYEGGQSFTQAEKDALDYHWKIHQAFHRAGNPAEATLWEDHLLHGRTTLVGELAESVNAGDGVNGLMSAVENISEADWQSLKDPKKREHFNGYVRNSMAAMGVEESDSQGVLDLLAAKADCTTYEEAKNVRRRLREAIKDSEQSRFLGMGTTYDPKSILENIGALNKSDAALLHTNNSFFPDIKRFIDEESGFNDDQKAYAHRMIDKAAYTGLPAEHTPGDLKLRALAFADGEQKGRNEADEPLNEHKYSGDGRQLFHDNHDEALQAESGAKPDGTLLALRRATDEFHNDLEDHQSAHRTLPGELQKRRDEHCQTTLEQHRQAKEKIAEVVASAGLTTGVVVAGLLAAPASGGTSILAAGLYLSAAAAATGAAYTVGVKSAVIGDDYTADRIAGDAVRGGVMGAFSFVVPPGATGAAGALQGVKGATSLQLARQAGWSGAFGAGSNAFATACEIPFSEQESVAGELATSTTVGGVVGALMPVAFRGVSRTFSRVTADGASVDIPAPVFQTAQQSEQSLSATPVIGDARDGFLDGLGWPAKAQVEGITSAPQQSASAARPVSVTADAPGTVPSTAQAAGDAPHVAATAEAAQTVSATEAPKTVPATTDAPHTVSTTADAPQSVSATATDAPQSVYAESAASQQALPDDGREISLPWVSEKRWRDYRDQQSSRATEIMETARRLRQEGNYDEAVRKLEKAAALRQEIYGPRHPSFGETLAELGDLHVSMGDYAKAERLLQKAHDIRNGPIRFGSAVTPDMLGPTDIKISNALGHVYAATDRLPEAQEAFIHSYNLQKYMLESGAQYEEAAVDRAWATAASLASVYSRRGRKEDADRLYEAFNTPGTPFPTIDPYGQVSMVYLNPARLEQQSTKAMELITSARELGRAGNPAEAIENIQKALRIRQEIYGHDHPLVIEGAAELGEQLVRAQRLEVAEYYLDHVTDLLSRASRHSENLQNEITERARLTALNALGKVYAYSGRLDKAEEVLERAADIRWKRHAMQLDTSEDPSWAEPIELLGGVYRNQGKLEKAESLFRHLETSDAPPDIHYATTGGKQSTAPGTVGGDKSAAAENQHYLVGSELAAVGQELCDESKYAEAIEKFQQTITVRAMRYGPDHPSIADGLARLADVYIRSDNLAQAEPLLNRARQLLSQQTLDTSEFARRTFDEANIRTLNGLGRLYYLSGRAQEAEEALRQSWGIQWNRYALNQSAPSDPAWQNTINDLAAVYLQLGKPDEANRLLHALGNFDSVPPVVTPSAVPDKTFQSIDEFRQVVASREQAYGAQHPLVGESLSQLGDELIRANRLAEAETVLERARFILRRPWAAAGEISLEAYEQAQIRTEQALQTIRLLGGR